MHDVVITGMGIVSALGCDINGFHQRLHAGERAFEPAPWPSDRGPV
ncbi:hypothetical protein ABZ599_37210 [Streptomyces misionensis]